MRATTTALALALQQLLQQDAAYTQLLAAVESDLAKKLRFRPTAMLLQSPVICGFVDALAQLRHLHRMFGERIGALAAAGANDADMEERIVDTLADMLCAVRFLYGQLFCRAEHVQAALEAADDAASTDILRRFLESAGLAVADFVMRPLQRFHALVEFVEELSPMCQDTSLAPRLLRLALDTRQYIHAVQSEARDELELVALQTQIEPSAALQSVDLSAETLLLHGEVGVAALRVAADSLVGLQSERLYAHCFQSGKLIYSRRSANDTIAGVADASADRFSIHGHLELKQDPVFVEPVPSAALARDGAVKGALVLISSYESVVLGFEDAGVARQWGEAAASLLSQNEVRSRVLQSQRSFDDIQVPLEASKQLKLTKRRDSLVPFPSFHDDDLPGIFWLESEDNSGSGGATWELVELMVYDHWLLVSKLVGWKHHTLLHHLDCRHAALSVQEAPSGENEWGLELTATQKEPLRLRLASKRRSRVDFWFDQISKTISKFPHAAASAEEELAPPASSVVEHAASASASAPATKTRRKRRASERELPPGDPASAVTKSSGTRSSKSSVVALEAIEGGGEGDDAMVLDTSKPKRSRPEAAPQPEPPIVHATVMKSPAIKTPKRRWLKLKEDDPDDSSLLDTDVSQDTVESTTRLSQSQPTTANTDVRIILTGIDATPAIRKKIKAIGDGAVYEEDIERATHV
ncbi:hypothetical protein PybrP1_004311, partial [[Pythium] brassicae (nom. inval.)]